mmetsp:Transcript_27277/g.50546  ORF Transcript_27277/g.50546 Transcript_27277/m.50546 type:complete len:349 (-) Transcript_27277:788-1834(-)
MIRRTLEGRMHIVAPALLILPPIEELRPTAREDAIASFAIVAATAIVAAATALLPSLSPLPLEGQNAIVEPAPLIPSVEEPRLTAGEDAIASLAILAAIAIVAAAAALRPSSSPLPLEGRIAIAEPMLLIPRVEELRLTAREDAIASFSAFAIVTAAAALRPSPSPFPLEGRMAIAEPMLLVVPVEEPRLRAGEDAMASFASVAALAIVAAAEALRPLPSPPPEGVTGAGKCPRPRRTPESFPLMGAGWRTPTRLVASVGARWRSCLPRRLITGGEATPSPAAKRGSLAGVRRIVGVTGAGNDGVAPRRRGGAVIGLGLGLGLGWEAASWASLRSDERPLRKTLALIS